MVDALCAEPVFAFALALAVVLVGVAFALGFGVGLGVAVWVTVRAVGSFSEKFVVVGVEPITDAITE